MEGYIEVKKEFLEEVTAFLKDSAYEGNVFAQSIIKKYDLK